MSPLWISPRAGGASRRQQGNAVVLALLGLLISALGAVGVIQGSRLQAKHEAGNGEATILDNLRGATNNAILESMRLIQSGAAFSKSGVTVTPVDVGGVLVWRPTVLQLVGMGYLPAGWSATTSTLNEAPYTISFSRVPAGCVTAACNIEGHIVLEGPIRSGSVGSDSDGAVIGPILARIGADSGVSLPMDPAHIQGFGKTWILDNPVPGQPPGVVAVRVGTASSGFGAFVRIGDTRDPSLLGNLTVAGNTLFGDGTTRSEFRSALQVDAQPVELRDASGAACVSLRPDGVVDILCTGSLSATTGVFRDASGRTTTIAATGLVTGGNVAADGGLSTSAMTVFGAGDPQALVVKSGDVFVRNPAGTALLRVAANGDVTAGNDLVAAGAVTAQRLTLSATVNEGDACSPGQVAMMATGGLATCQGATFRASARYARLGQACAPAGLQAVDVASADALVCRGGYYASQSWLTSSRVYMAGFAVRHGDFIAAATALPSGCPATSSPVPPQATIFLLPQTDSETPGNPILNRNATWTGLGWAISLTDGTGAATTSNAVAEVYCLYP
ncbi:MAG: hypothetical protein ACJ8GJ_22830 [Vitreoscilla sp.]